MSKITAGQRRLNTAVIFFFKFTTRTFKLQFEEIVFVSFMYLDETMS